MEWFRQVTRARQAAPQGCPYPAEQAGDACASPDLYCAFDCELPILCQNHVWQWGQENCPICAAPDTLIATPHGERPIASLRVGDLVYSVEHDAIVPFPIVRTGSKRVASHHVVRVVLNDGRVIEMSPGHPTADGAPTTYETFESTTTILGGNTIFMPTEFLHALYDGSGGAGLDDYWSVTLASRVGAGGFDHLLSLRPVTSASRLSQLGRPTGLRPSAELCSGGPHEPMRLR